MRRALVSSAATCLALAVSAELRSQGDNVLIVVADDLGVENVGVYAEAANPPPTPNIDALAARGVLFRNAWSNPSCSPTRACIQTGRYTTRTGVGQYLQNWLPGQVPILQNTLPLAETTLPELLDAQQSGYAHAAIGKWHLNDEMNGGALGPNLAGWSHFAGIIGGKVGNYFEWPRNVNGATQISTVYSTTQMVDDALDWIQGSPEPWVVYLCFNAPHKPFHEPPAALHTQSLHGLSKALLTIGQYKAMIEAMDTEMGRLFSTLGPIMSRTNVIFMGDNGTPKSVVEPPFLPSHAKGSPYEGGVNVPLIVAGPAVLGPAREEAALVSAVDVFSTVAELCGVSPRPPGVQIDGVSFRRHLRAPTQPPVRPTVFTEWFRGPAPFGNLGHAAIRNSKYKLIRLFRRGGYREELYDLSLDPFETQDLMLGVLTAEQQSNYNALAAEWDAIRLNAGSFSEYGSRSCAGSAGVPVIAGIGIPRVGSSYSVWLDRGPSEGGPAALLTGTSNTQWGPLSLPFQLTGSGPNCLVFASGEIIAPATVTPTPGAAGRASVSISVPGSASLVSAPIFHSWLVFDPAAPANPAGITTSSGAAVVLGG